jgi:hypothetical protein
MQVVIRVPWKRPKNFVADWNRHPKSDLETSSTLWTPERDAELWKLLALSPPDQVDCKFQQVVKSYFHKNANNTLEPFILLLA